MGILDFFKRNRGKSSGEGSSKDISTRDEINTLLESLAEDRTDCNMLIGSAMFNSMFINSGKDAFSTDLMIPLASNTLLSTGQGVRIGFIYEDIPYRMYCTYQGREKRDDLEALVFSKPTQIHYVDRRENRRVNPVDERGVRVLFDMGVSTMPNAELENISETGIAIRTALTDKMRVGAVLDRLDIILPNSDWISCKGIVRRIRGNVLGIELKDLSLVNRKALLRFIENKKQAEKK